MIKDYKEYDKLPSTIKEALIGIPIKLRYPNICGQRPPVVLSKEKFYLISGFNLSSTPTKSNLFEYGVRLELQTHYGMVVAQNGNLELIETDYRSTPNIEKSIGNIFKTLMILTDISRQNYRSILPTNFKYFGIKQGSVTVKAPEIQTAGLIREGNWVYDAYSLDLTKFKENLHINLNRCVKNEHGDVKVFSPDNRSEVVGYFVKGEFVKNADYAALKKNSITA